MRKSSPFMFGMFQSRHTREKPTESASKCSERNQALRRALTIGTDYRSRCGHDAANGQGIVNGEDFHGEWNNSTCP